MNAIYTGPVSEHVIAEIYRNNLNSNENGAHALFLGQVRADKFSEQNVIGIEYSAYIPMAEQKIELMINESKIKYGFNEVIIKHSVGLIKAGEVSVLVWVKSKHRKNVFIGLEHIVERLKYDIPVWKKEIFDDESHRWIEERKM